MRRAAGVRRPTGVAMADTGAKVDEGIDRVKDKVTGS
jgi:hypothetical protein